MFGDGTMATPNSAIPTGILESQQLVPSIVFVFGDHMTSLSGMTTFATGMHITFVKKSKVHSNKVRPPHCPKQ